MIRISEIHSIVLLVLLFLSLGFSSYGQCNMPDPQAGFYCSLDSLDGPPLLCDLDCLNGYTARMPAFQGSTQPDQPSPLCPGSDTGGQPHNMSWFAFVAGSPTIRLEIRPFNCTTENGCLLYTSPSPRD